MLSILQLSEVPTPPKKMYMTLKTQQIYCLFCQPFLDIFLKKPLCCSSFDLGLLQSIVQFLNIFFNCQLDWLEAQVCFSL